MLLSYVSLKLQFINASVTSVIKFFKEVPVIGIEIPLFFAKFTTYFERFCGFETVEIIKKYRTTKNQ